MRYKHIFNYGKRRQLDPTLRVIFNRVLERYNKTHNKNITYEQVKHATETAFEWQKKEMRKGRVAKLIWSNSLMFILSNVTELCQTNTKKYYNHNIAMVELRSIQRITKKRIKAKMILDSLSPGNIELLEYLNPGDNLKLANYLNDTFDTIFTKLIRKYNNLITGIHQDLLWVTEFGRFKFDPDDSSTYCFWDTVYISNKKESVINFIINLLKFFIKTYQINKVNNLNIQEQKEIVNIINTSYKEKHIKKYIKNYNYVSTKDVIKDYYI